VASSRGAFPGYHEIRIVAVPYLLNARPDLQLIFDSFRPEP